MFYYWLAPLGKQFILFNLFNYIAFRAAGAGVTALVQPCGRQIGALVTTMISVLGILVSPQPGNSHLDE